MIVVGNRKTGYRPEQATPFCLHYRRRDTRLVLPHGTMRHQLQVLQLM